MCTRKIELTITFRPATDEELAAVDMTHLGADEEGAVIHLRGKLLAVADEYGIRGVPGVGDFPHMGGQERWQEQMERAFAQLVDVLPPVYPPEEERPYWVPICYRCGYRQDNHKHKDACAEFVEAPEHLRF